MYVSGGAGGSPGYYGKGDKYRSDLVLPFNAGQTTPRGINSAGTVVGLYVEYSSTVAKGFIVSDGAAISVQYPDASAHATAFQGINRSGLISGSWGNSDRTANHAFLYDQSANAFSEIAVPNASMVFAYGINRGGVVAVEADGLPYIYCRRHKTCPLKPAQGIDIPEKWIQAPAANIRTVLCKNGCRGPLHESARVKPADVAAMRATMARDPDLRFELRTVGAR
jgi:hypothetical protein